jgi:hypothetical protein
LEATASEQEEGYQRARREWWRFGVVIALLLLIAEWLVYNRSAIAKIYKRLTSSLNKRFSARV